MEFKVLASSSSGNSYLLYNDGEALLIECGVRFALIQQAINYEIRKIKGCLLTHEHKDHCLCAKEVLEAGIPLFASYGTHNAIGTTHHHRSRFLHDQVRTDIDRSLFRVLPFNTNHDVAEPLGFLINHPETGGVLFLTDSYFSEYVFNNLNNVIIEANYDQELLDTRRNDGETLPFLRDRVVESHMSLATCKGILRANDLSNVNNIVLVHLSDSNSDADRFKREIEETTGKVVHVAEPGLVISNFNKTPF